MDSLIFELQIVFYFQLFLSANVRHKEVTRGYCGLRGVTGVHQGFQGVTDG